MERDISQFIENKFGRKIDYVRRIVDGHSVTEKYEITISGQRFFVRVLQDDAHLKEKYSILMVVGEAIPEICAPTHLWKADNKLIVLTEWFDGIPLDQYYSQNPSISQIDIAKRVGHALHRLHTLTECSAEKLHNCFNMEQLTSFVSKFLSASPPIHAITELPENLCRSGPFSLIHYDLRPANVLLSSAGKLKIIDFEYMDYMPSYLDMSICLLFSSRFSEYGQGVIEGYFNGPPPSAFWKQQKTLLIHEMIRYSLNSRNSDDDVQKKLQQALMAIEKAETLEQKSPAG